MQSVSSSSNQDMNVKSPSDSQQTPLNSTDLISPQQPSQLEQDLKQTPTVKQGYITCLECRLPFKSLSAHMRTHKMSLDDYIRKHTDSDGNPPPVGWTSAQIDHGKGPMDVSTARQAWDPKDAILKSLSPPERSMYTTRFEMLMRQADNDPALESAVQDIVLGEINIARYQHQISNINAKLGTKSWGPVESKTLTALEKLKKDTQETNLKLMDSLNLTRAKKQSKKSTIESTPSRFISSFEMYIRTLKPEQLAMNNQEMEESAARLRRNLGELKLLVPVDAVAEPDDSSI